MELIQLIYVSTATSELSPKETRHILDASVRHNMRQHLTGLLLYSHGSFMQVLEGDQAAVDETMSRIGSDPRHHNISLMSRSPIASREFGKWAMAFRGIRAPEEAILPSYAPFFRCGFNAQVMEAKPGLALEILHQFAKTTH